MSALPAITVVIPCFNAQNYLERAVRSVFDQEVAATEILIVDDCSVDDTAAVADRLAGEHAQIRVWRQPVNGGPAAARNAGLRISHGKYVCFLDADDEYLPMFFQSALGVLEREPATAAFVSYIELANCNREVHPVQLNTVAASLPGNLMTRRAVCELLGGFSEDPAFRTPFAGEDYAFRLVLRTFFHVHYDQRTFFRYYIQPGSHFHRFLDRSVVEGGKLRFTFEYPAERDGTAVAAQNRYYEAAQQRLAACYRLKRSLPAVAVQATHDIQSAALYEALRSRFDPVQGYLHSREGYALYRWAMSGPGEGVVVEIGSFMGRATCWLAQGTLEAQRDKVVAVDQFCGSSEHQTSQSHDAAEIVPDGSTLPQFQANIARMGLTDWVEPRVGSSEQIAADWSRPIRLLFISGDPSLEASQRNLAAWGRLVDRNGCIALHGIGVHPGVTQFYQTMMQRNRHLHEVCSVNSLRIFRMV